MGKVTIADQIYVAIVEYLEADPTIEVLTYDQINARLPFDVRDKRNQLSQALMNVEYNMDCELNVKRNVGYQVIRTPVPEVQPITVPAPSFFERCKAFFRKVFE